MPKILINEVDNTSAGTPGRYGNYSVLITGYKQTEYSAKELEQRLDVTQAKNRQELCDANGVYEFTSATTFKNTIGEAPVEKSVADGEPECHYGNKMALELLNLGYTVIYKVIDKIADMNSDEFWGVFRDKASYDFRFVSHGLLTTMCDQTNYKTWVNRLSDLEDAKEILEKIKEYITIDPDKAVKNETKMAEMLAAAYEEEYQRIKADYPGLKDSAGIPYSSYAVAYEVFEKNAEAVELEATIAEHDEEHVTSTVFNEINGHIAKLAAYRADDQSEIPGRGDCIALIELDENCYVKAAKPVNGIIEGINNMSCITDAEGPYCAMTVPSVFYKMNSDVVKFPGAFHYLACFMNSLRNGFAEWYAAAGYTRGVSSYVIDHTSVKLGEIAINALEPRNLVDDEQKVQPKFACNVIANFRGSYYLWGNRTAFGLKSAAGGGDLVAHHFLNIRQLCTTIKKQVYVACRRFTFDPNSDTLWVNFVNAITPTLDAMKADQGIRDYKIIKVFTDKKATLKAKIRIIPIEAVEDFDITISLEDSFGGVAVTAE